MTLCCCRLYVVVSLSPRTIAQLSALYIVLQPQQHFPSDTVNRHNSHFDTRFLRTPKARNKDRTGMKRFDSNQFFSFFNRKYDAIINISLVIRFRRKIYRFYIKSLTTLYSFRKNFCSHGILKNVERFQNMWILKALTNLRFSKRFLFHLANSLCFFLNVFPRKS